ncbi:hypothetical protein ACIQ4I_16625 [Rummeliibacillus sp. NPDC094406]|uniref:hypothetical protein n=1 Tax=Rummeliibacillus sp. NPDC094406 TaxID=3364511 RepID=UPI003816A5A3
MFKIIYIISFLMSVLLFYLCNDMTQTLNINSEFGVVGGNGNLGLFPWIFLFPFFGFFVYGTFKYSMLTLTKLAKAKKIMMLAGSGVLSFIIVINVYNQASELRKKIVEVSPTYTRESELSLLNFWSNSIFFNFFTFLLVILLTILLSAGMTMLKSRVPRA